MELNKSNVDRKEKPKTYLKQCEQHMIPSTAQNISKTV